MGVPHLVIANIVVAAQDHGGEGGKAVALSKDGRIADRVVVVRCARHSTGNPAQSGSWQPSPRGRGMVCGALRERPADRGSHRGRRRPAHETSGIVDVLRAYVAARGGTVDVVAKLSDRSWKVASSSVVARSGNEDRSRRSDLGRVH